MSEAAARAAQRLTLHILIALVAGALVGLILHFMAPSVPWVQTYVIGGALKLIGGLFKNGLQLLVVPLVFFSLVAGTAALRDPASLGRLGWKTLVLYMGTTLIAVTVALTLATLIQPGAGVDTSAAAEFTPPESPPLITVPEAPAPVIVTPSRMSRSPVALRFSPAPSRVSV